MTPSKQSYRTITLTKNQVTTVDALVYEWASQWNWYAHWNKHTNSFYAARRTTVDGKRGRVFLHRAILGLSPNDPLQGDHSNGDTLDNRRRNLRTATPSQNTQNSKMRSDNTTGYRGVSPVYGSKSGKWIAQIRCHKKYKYLGTFATAKEAGDAYKAAARIICGEFFRSS